MNRFKNILVFFLATLIFVASNGFALKQCLCICNICNDKHPKLVLFEIDDHDHKDAICVANHCSGCSTCSNEFSSDSDKTDFSFYKLETLFSNKDDVRIDKSQVSLDTNLDFITIIPDKINTLVYNFNILKKQLEGLPKFLIPTQALYLQNSSLRL